MNKKQRRERSHLMRTINELSRLHVQQQHHSLSKHSENIRLEAQLIRQKRENRDWLIELLPIGLRWLARWRLLHRTVQPAVLPPSKELPEGMYRRHYAN